MGEIAAHHQRTPAQIEFSGNHALRQNTHIGRMGRVNAAHVRHANGRLRTVGRLGFQHHRPKHKRGNAAYVSTGGHDAHDPLVVVHGLADSKNFQVRVEAKDFIAQVVVKAAHDADNDDEHRHADRDPYDGDEGDDRDERPFGPQIAEGQHQFKRQLRHDFGRLKAAGPRVNEGW